MTILAPPRNRSVHALDDHGEPISFIDLRRAVLDDNAAVSADAQRNATAAALALGYSTLEDARLGLCLPING